MITTSTIYQQGLQQHRDCLLCGENNPHSLGLRFAVRGDAVTARFQLATQLQGYTGLLHGGIISSLLDAAMTHCLFHQGIQALTAELQLRFIAPIPIDACVDIEGKLLSRRRGIYHLEASLTLDGQVHARATAKFLQPKPGVITRACMD